MTHRLRALVWALALLTAGFPASMAAGGEPAPAQSQGALARARSHAHRRLVDSLLRRLRQSQPRLQPEALEPDLAHWLDANRPAFEVVRRYDDGSLEVRLSIPVSEVVRFLRGMAQRGDPALRLLPEKAYTDLAPPGAPAREEIAGFSDPRDRGEGGTRTPAGPAWAGASAPHRSQVLAAAHYDALDNVWGKVSALEVSPGVSVRDFLEADPRRRDDLMRLVNPSLDRGLASPRYYPDGRCEVDSFLDLADLRSGIVQVARIYNLPAGSPWRTLVLQTLVESNGGRRILWASGRGFLPDAPGRGPDWRTRTLTAVGHGAYPEVAQSAEHARALAAREAQDAARQKLFEKILALEHPSGGTLGALGATPERGNALRELVQRQEAGQGVFDRSGAQRPIEISLEKVWDLVKDWK